VNGARLSDYSGFGTRADVASFKPGTTTSTRCAYTASTSCGLYTVSLLKPNELQVGQHVTLENAGAAGDVIVLIRDIVSDEATVETSSSITFSETGNTTNLADCYDSSGTTLTCDGSCAGTCALDTEITGRTWIKGDGEWRQVVKVTSATAGILDAAFTAPLSNDTIAKLDVDVTSNAHQHKGMRLDSGVAGPLTVTDADFTGNLTTPIDNQAGALNFIVANVQPPEVATANADGSGNLAVPARTSMIQVTSTNAIDTLTGPIYAGRVLTFLFTVAVSVDDSDGGGENIMLAGANVTFAADADDTLTVRCDGTSCFETGRSVN